MAGLARIVTVSSLNGLPSAAANCAGYPPAAGSDQWCLWLPADNQLLHIHIRRIEEAAFIAYASTASALAWPIAVMRVPSIDQQQYLPRRRDQYRLFHQCRHRCFVDFTFTNDDGAVNVDLLSIIRMAFTAAPSAVFLSPLLTICSQPAPLIR